MAILRSILLNLLFFGWLAIILLSLWVLLPFPRAGMRGGVRIWAKGGLWIMRWIAGIKYEIRGMENFPAGAGIIASKHQSNWDTMVFYALCHDPAYIMKAELIKMPLWGWYARKVEAIGVDRSGGASALKDMAAGVRRVLGQDRTVIIFPEGTRTAPDAPTDYQPGIAALYRNSKMPVVPVALNSGLFWGRRSRIVHRGTIVLEFLPPIPAGLPRRDFMARLETDIETATSRLIAEGRAKHPRLPPA